MGGIPGGLLVPRLVLVDVRWSAEHDAQPGALDAVQQYEPVSDHHDDCSLKASPISWWARQRSLHEDHYAVARAAA